MNCRINGAVQVAKDLFFMSSKMLLFPMMNDETRMDMAHRSDRHSLIGSALSVANRLKLWMIFGSPRSTKRWNGGQIFNSNNT